MISAATSALPETRSILTRDGVRLDADVYRPPQPGRYPVLLMRQPYGRKIASTICYAHPSWYAAHGYIVVIQDVRGRGTSEGTFALFNHEAADGFDTIEWAAALEGASGAVGMYGFSFQGTNQLLAAGERPRALRALAPAMIGWDMRRDWAYENGAFCLRASLGWALQLAAESARREGDAAAFRELSAAARALPLDGLIPCRPEVLERYRTLTHYFDWLDNDEQSPYWTAISPAARAAVLAEGPPMLFVGGWYDSHLPGTLAAYRSCASNARLIVGPWAHFPWGRYAGSAEFGPAAIGEIDQAQLRWFDRWLKHEAAAEDEAHLRLFDLGARRWRDFEAWPCKGDRFFLASAGRAALDERAGRLEAGGGSETSIEYLVHDPWRPVPTLGGRFGVPAGPADRRAIDARPDVLTFTTPPLESTCEFAGAVSARLFVEADAPSFDLSCTLARIASDGRVLELTAGYCKVSAASMRVPVTVPMGATCVALEPGDALRLSIAASSFPAYPVNPGTGLDPTKARAVDASIITLRLGLSEDANSSLSVGLG